jgi:hypothetical protein
MKAYQRLVNTTSTLNKMDFLFITLGVASVMYEGFWKFIISIAWRQTPNSIIFHVTDPVNFFIASWVLAILIIGLLSLLLLKKEFGNVNKQPDNFHLD